MNIILLGLKHSGKSTLGREVGRALNLVFFDTDDIIIKMTGLSPRTLYKENGKDAFIKAEAAACRHIKTLLPSTTQKSAGALIATGGGVCDNSEALLILKDLGVFVFIDTAECVIIDRILREGAFDGALYHNIPSFLGLSASCGVTKSAIENAFHSFYIRRKARYSEISKASIPLDATSSIESSTKKIICAIQSL